MIECRRRSSNIERYRNFLLFFFVVLCVRRWRVGGRTELEVCTLASRFTSPTRNPERDRCERVVDNTDRGIITGVQWPRWPTEPRVCTHSGMLYCGSILSFSGSLQTRSSFSFFVVVYLCVVCRGSSLCNLSSLALFFWFVARTFRIYHEHGA